MIRTLAVTQDGMLEMDVPFEQLEDERIDWYWVDYEAATQEERLTLDTHFHFHPLAIEDCVHFLQRPKLDHYDETHFFVLHAMNDVTLEANEVDLFLNSRFIVTFHLEPNAEIEEAWSRFTQQPGLRKQGPLHAAYMVMDKLVDQYFPSVHRIEDELNEIEFRSGSKINDIMDQVFKLRSDLLKLRRTIVPMRDLLYRVVNSQRIEGLKSQMVYFQDIYDHLLKLSEMIESNRELTADLRDNYLSISSNRMNHIMKTLTVITVIFMPLTFIAGVYGMNFDWMPELEWSFGYPLIVGLMAALGLGMFTWFKRKGWFE
ncbi:metal transporter [Paenibacillus swuensis]|uniref:Magnesium transport protein CorA n=1 Tax=Paenibacillus swuensis TaxID=1178515 RepID=A0A172TGP1_9BACL|nr:magnesium/cobalt transporter CorA [Paenibacillus swuensis]ANE45953.1 metal transporter [Paenibacillus swuensis]